jgi:hypothetical protein
MASYIKTLKEDNGDITYPQTLASAVITTGGTDIETAIASKADASTVSGKIDMGDVTAADLTASVFSAIYPVGSIYMSATMNSAAQVEAAFGGTWEAWGAGRVPVGVDASQSEFDTVEETGGEKTHLLTVDEMPSHRHRLAADVALIQTGGNFNYDGSYTRSSGKPYTDYTGGGQAHNNLQPYITCYMYKRTA